MKSLIKQFKILIMIIIIEEENNKKNHIIEFFLLGSWKKDKIRLNDEI